MVRLDRAGAKLGIALAVAMLTVWVVDATAQQKPRGGAGRQGERRRGDLGGNRAPGDGQIDGRGGGKAGSRVVTGAPYSAEVVTESVRTLADGTKLTRRNEAKVYRDSQGRSRREQEATQFGPPGDSGEAPRAVFISDPVLGVAYTLYPERRTGRREVMRPAGEVVDAAEKQARKGEAGRKDPSRKADREQTRAARGRGARAGVGSPSDDAAGGAVGGGEAGRNGYEVRVEPLGKREINGLMADGERRTTIIPVNRIGNDRPLEIVEERWKSPELKTTVYSRTVDPRWGEQTFQLTKINRSEPDTSLFAPTPEYTIQEGRGASVDGNRQGVKGKGSDRGPGGARGRAPRR